MENEMIMNEEVIEDTFEEIVKVAKHGKGLDRFLVGAAVVVVSGVTYKYAVKPIVNKFKAKKAAKNEIKEASEEPIEVTAEVIED